MNAYCKSKKMKKWPYFENPFLNCAKKSYKKAVKISTYTDGQLFARRLDPIYTPLYAAYHPLHLLLLAAYNKWKAENDVQISTTVTITDLLKKLSSIKILAWDLTIQAVYIKGSAEYVLLMAHGHKPFQTGTKLERINTVAQLKEKLVGIVPLATLETEVSAFLNNLTDAETSQSGKIGNKKKNSKDVLKALTNTMVEMFSILGSMQIINKQNPTDSASLFDMDTIRNQEQSTFTGALKNSEYACILERTFLLTSSMDATSDALTDLGFYLASNANDPSTGHTIINVPAGTTVSITFSSFTGDTNNTFLCVVNLSSIAAGRYEIDLG